MSGIEDIGITLDTLPDNDSFLPRYLTVQLLELLAKTVNTTTADSTTQTLNNPKFVDTFKSEQLFTPLTYSIFWRDNITQALAKNELPIDTTDKYNRAPLTLAIANEDFSLACTLLKMGAALMLEDKLVLEIALISMLQRDPEIINKILQESVGYDITWVKEYLEYLNSYVQGSPIAASRYHDVLNPPLRQFGQVLDTLAFFNGLPSHYGFMSPSIDILSGHLKIYLQEMDPNNSFCDAFATISDAYSSTAQICKYFGNLPTNNDAAQNLSTKIQANIKADNGKAIVVFGGWAGNSIAMAFINNTLIFSNLGIGGNPEAGTKIFNISKPENITPQFIDSFMRGLGNATAPYTILDQIGAIVDIQPLYALAQTFNPIDNCIFVNPRAIIEGMLLVLGAIAKDKKITASTLQVANPIATQAYIAYVNSLYKYSVSDLSNFMRNNQLLQNKRLECCALALDYINQHYSDSDALKRCIELKNALEFVGLKDFYLSSINTEARTAIQALMIQEQEATAIKVIQQENAMIANASKRT